MYEPLEDVLETIELAKEAAMQGRDMTRQGLKWSRERWLEQWAYLSECMDVVENELRNLALLLDR